MRIRKFHLNAYGPFRKDTSLDLGGNGVHILYGPNEAGKSSALRAFEAFFFGIDSKNTDDFLYPSKTLKVGAEIEWRDGTSEAFFRKRASGKREGLVDVKGKAIPADTLSHFPGVTKEDFSRTYGLDPERLAKEADNLMDTTVEAVLLQAQGFDPKPLQDEIGKNLEVLFLPAAKVKKINKGLSGYEGLKKQLEETLLKPETYAKQKNEVAECEERVKRLDEELNDIEEKIKKLSALRSAVAYLKAKRELESAFDEARRGRFLDHQKAIEEAGKKIELYKSQKKEAEEADWDSETLAKEASSILKDIWPQLGEAELEELANLSLTQRESIRQLIGAIQEAEKTKSGLKESLAKKKKEWNDAKEELKKIESVDGESLEKACREARGFLYLERRIEDLKKEIESLEATLEEARKRLSFGENPQSTESPEVLAIPKSSETVHRFADFKRLDFEGTLKGLVQGQDREPSVRQLLQALALLDERIKTMGLEQNLQGELSSLREKAGTFEKRLEAIEEELGNIPEKRAELNALWKEAWERAGMTPWPLEKIDLPRLQDYCELYHNSRNLLAKKKELKKLEEEFGPPMTRLQKTLEEFKISFPPGDSLRTLLESGEAYNVKSAQSEKKKLKLQAEIEGYQKGVEELESERIDLEQAIERAMHDLWGLLKQIRIDGAVLPAVLERFLGALDDSHRKNKEAQIKKDEASSKRKSAQEFEDKVKALGQKMGIDPEKDIEVVVGELVEGLEKCLDFKKKEEDFKETCAREERDPEETQKEAEDENEESLKEKLERLDQEKRTLKKNLQEASEAKGKESKIFEDMEKGSSQASEIQQELEEVLCELEEDCRMYVREKLAACILEQVLENYKKRTKEAFLEKAGKYFSRLTGGSFEGVETEEGEKGEILVGVRGDSDERLSTSAMSDGTRDQLYLALRLAALELHSKKAEPFPFVLDDVLVRFDDERTKAALKAFEELSQKTQVLLFTHHSHILELANQTITQERLHIHELNSAGNARSGLEKALGPSDL